MRQALLPDQEEVTLESLTTTASSGVLMMLRTLRPEVACPSCGTLSRRVHSRYLRAIADLPWEGVSVMIRLRTRRFFCADDGCTKRIFVEPLPQTVSRYGRRTCRSRHALDSIAMALGGAAGARLARQLGLLVHRSTLLRVLRQRRSLAVPVTPRVLGIDAGLGARAAATELSCATWSVAASWISCPTANEQPSSTGYAFIPALRSSAATAIQPTPRPCDRRLRRPFKLPIAGIYCAAAARR